MFVDEVTITLKAGDGGRGTVSFRREKFIPRGGPDGGDGGHGGSIYLAVDANLSTLSHLRGQHHFHAQDGKPGGRNKRRGKSGQDATILVPAGTRVRRSVDGPIFCELNQVGERVLAAKGGSGGRGNSRFATSTNRAPRTYEDGGEGEKFTFFLELRLLAQVALIGLPNAGKSTILKAITNATPQVSGYPFTTLTPNLGVVDVDEINSFVISDLPGIISGAHLGVGLGDRFLRHIERSAVLCAVIDVGGEVPSDPAKNLETIIKELRLRNARLAERLALVIANKIDLPNAAQQLEMLKRKCHLPIVAISALKRRELNRLVRKLFSLVLERKQPTEVSIGDSGL